MKPNTLKFKQLPLLLALVILVINQNVFAQTSSKLTIVNQDYELAKLESKKQHKMLLIDFYTTWCVPCRYLDEAIFKDAVISEEVAKNFVVLKYDAEKDKDHRLTLKYHIQMYPSTVILNENQFVVDRLYGTCGSEKELVKNYMAFLSKSIASNASNYYVKGISNSNNVNYPKFYEEYVYRTNTKNVSENLKNYWQANPDHFEEATFTLLCYFDGGSDEMINFFFQNKKKYEDLFGELDVKWLRSLIISKKVYAAFDAKDRKLFNEAKAIAKANMLAKDTTSYFLALDQQMLMKEERWADAIKILAQRMKQSDYDTESTNSFCWSVYEKCNDQQVLIKCASLMKNLTQRSPDFNKLDTYARLLHKIGNKKLAITTIQKAISVGKSKKEDTRSAEEWLKKIVSHE
jgi:thiol-disulfide isomerase/thioredoxin